MAIEIKLLHSHYLELRKMRQIRINKLEEQQKRVQQHENSLFKIKTHLAQVKIELSKVKEKLNELLNGNVWVTAKEHEKIHKVCELVTSEYHDWTLLKLKKYQLIDKEAQEAKIHASHIIGIERALICLKDQMFSNKSNLSLPTMDSSYLFLRPSQSQSSFTSIVSANSKNSTSLSGALLKKWFKPRLQVHAK